MAKKPSALSKLIIWRDKIVSHLPPVLKKRWDVLNASQQRNISIIAAGLVVFLLVWFVASDWSEQPTTIVSARQLQFPSKEQGIKTAITQPAKSFPDQTVNGAAVAPAKPDIIDTLNLTPLQKDQLLELRQNVDNIYKSVLSFTLDEAKMIVFAQAASKIDMINAKWDTLIAGAPDDKLATEYLTSATLESRTILEQNVGITAPQYNEIYNLSARDANFNKIANAYKSLVSAGIWGPVTPILQDDKSVPVNPDLRFPVSKPVAINPAVPAGSGTAPTQQGLPVPPYSPPPAR